jgi:hypothetical protein
MNLRLAGLIIAIMLILAGCSGGGSPLSPDMPYGDGNPRIAAMPDSGNFLWGFWQGSINIARRTIDLTQLREAEFHSNIAGVLAVKPLGLSYQIQDFNMIEGTVSVDVSLTHPYHNSDFRGFDTRGIFMGPGATLQSSNDPGLIYPAPNGCRVLNADGYTRWWNAQEFITSGMFGYDDSSVVPGFLIPTTTLNPYKYFADCLGPDDPVVPNVNSTNRGTFSTDGAPPKLTRNYQIKFPKVGGQAQFMFHYAVDVSWAMSTPKAPPHGIRATPHAAAISSSPSKSSTGRPHRTRAEYSTRSNPSGSNLPLSSIHSMPGRSPLKQVHSPTAAYSGSPFPMSPRPRSPTRKC